MLAVNPRSEELLAVSSGKVLLTPNVCVERPEPAGRPGREADDDPGRFAARVLCRWRCA